jgi:hypothetical protein
MATGGRIAPLVRLRVRVGPQLVPAERSIARIASRAHGIVTRKELFDAGLTRAEIKRRVKKGALIPRYRGVYRVGHHAWSVEAEYMAAVKAAGEGALLCGRAARLPPEPSPDSHPAAARGHDADEQDGHWA